MAQSSLKYELVKRGLVKRSSCGDGHCLLYSLKSSWNSQFSSFKLPIDLHKLKCCLFVESVQNYNLFSPFFSDNLPLGYFRELRKYLLQKVYNQGFVDLAPQILANALKTNITVLNELSPTHVQVNLFPSRISTDETVTVHRQFDHYNGLVLAPLTLPKPTSIEKCITSCTKNRLIYIASHLKNIGASFIPKAKRHVRIVACTVHQPLNQTD